jgi:hypothetical protein
LQISLDYLLAKSKFQQHVQIRFQIPAPAQLPAQQILMVLQH